VSNKKYLELRYTIGVIVSAASAAYWHILLRHRRVIKPIYIRWSDTAYLFTQMTIISTSRRSGSGLTRETSAARCYVIGTVWTIYTRAGSFSWLMQKMQKQNDLPYYVFRSRTDLISLLILLFFFFFFFFFFSLRRPLKTNRIKMKFGMSILHVNMHRLTESDFQFDVTLSRWWLWRHFIQKIAATWW